MQFSILLVVLLLLTFVGFRMGRGRAVQVAGPRVSSLHSLPAYYGFYVALWCGVPAVALIALWLGFEPTILRGLVIDALPPETRSVDAVSLDLIINEVRQLGSSGNYIHASSPVVAAAAEHYHSLRATSFAAMAVAALALALAGVLVGIRLIRPDLRARDRKSVV